MASGPLGALSHDEVGVVFEALATPLEPHVAVALASTCRGLRVPTVAALAELKRRHEAVKALLRKPRLSCAELREAASLSWYGMTLTVADCTALADVIKSSGLPRLERLVLRDNFLGTEGMQALSEGLECGALPSLKCLDLGNNGIGEAGASALGAALGRGALPRLQELGLGNNGLGCAGLIALAPGLRAHPQLKKLYFFFNGIGDDGVAALVAPGEGVLPSLETLDLERNQVTDAGCAALVAARSSGAMSSLKIIELESNPASAAARAALGTALGSRRGS